MSVCVCTCYNFKNRGLGEASLAKQDLNKHLEEVESEHQGHRGEEFPGRGKSKYKVQKRGWTRVPGMEAGRTVRTPGQWETGDDSGWGGVDGRGEEEWSGSGNTLKMELGGFTINWIGSRR